MISNLELTDVAFRRHQQVILNGVNFTVSPNQIVALLGANGAGKTTLLRIIAGVIPDFTGAVQVTEQTDPIAIKAASSTNFDHDLRHSHQRLLQYAKATRVLWPHFNLAQFETICEFFELSTTLHLDELSKGQRKQAQLALCLANRVPLYLLDEPFDGLDLMHQTQLQKGLLQFLPENASVLLTDHHVESIANLIDRVMILHHHTIQADISADEIREQSGQSISEYFQSFYQKED
jgi:ABC-2 type transport system ATP-binding protein